MFLSIGKVRDIAEASHVIGDMTGSALHDPLFERYKKLCCSIAPPDKDSDEYKMILKIFGQDFLTC